MTTNRFALVIFDCDGVLVDSEVITCRVFTQMLNELGIAASTAEVFDQFVGKTMPQCLERVEAMLGHAVPENFVEQSHQRTAAALQLELKAVPGIVPVLDSIELPYCVASNGSHTKMQTTLGLTGLLDRFSNKRFSVSDVARGKPFPDLFLYAASQFGVAPGACVVIEDTATGVTAGVAAGMTVFGYSARTPARRLRDAGAHRTFKRMSDLLPMLGQRGRHHG
jgi:HAD superfamily hydrolase (TIGR01509 family)